MGQCLINTGYVLSAQCLNSATGGIEEIYVKTFSAKTNGSTYTFDSDNVITGMDESVSASTWYTIELRRNSGEWNEPGEYNTENRNFIYVQDINLTFPKRNSETRNLLYLLARNDMLIILLDNKGLYWLVGQDFGCRITDSSGVSGRLMNDPNNQNLIIQSRELQPARLISSTLIGNLIFSS